MRSLSSEEEMYPWIQFDYMFPVSIDKVAVAQRWDCCHGWFEHVLVTVGNHPSIKGKEDTKNSKCAYYQGPALSPNFVVFFDCNPPIAGRYMIIQKRTPSPSVLSINEIGVYPTGNNCHLCVFPFTYHGVLYNDCTDAIHYGPWCATLTDSFGNYINNNFVDCGTESCIFL